MKFLIVGLGNIGAEYAQTRHNIGFLAIEHLLRQHQTTAELDRHAFVATVKHKGKTLHCIMPTTYMNLSGKAVRYHLDKFGVPKENLLVITDDIALDVGKIRLRAKGSDGGHNGLKSINELLGTQEYARLRVGVGSNFAKGKQADYVLGKFTAAETAELPFLLDRCEKAIYAFATVGVERAMNEVNTAK